MNKKLNTNLLFHQSKWRKTHETNAVKLKQSNIPTYKTVNHLTKILVNCRQVHLHIVKKTGNLLATKKIKLKAFLIYTLGLCKALYSTFCIFVVDSPKLGYL